MSKPDSGGGSLENILASIRRSLSEQSTDALAEDAPAAPAPPPPVEERNGAKRREGLAQRLAGTTVPPSPDAAERADDLAGLVEELPARTASGAASASASASAATAGSPTAESVSPAAAATPAVAPVQASPAAAAPAAAERSEGDPLWFLTPGPEPEASKAAEPSSGAGEPTLRPEVLRATMPPFFGSSTEAVKADVAPAAAPAVAVTRQPAARSDASRRGGEAEPAKAAARPVAADRAPAPAAEAVAQSHASATASPLRNGRANSHSEPAAEAPTVSRATVFGDSPNTHALEAVVVDMLRPMLREWLDENMPRLVASALADEAAARARTRDPKKP